MKSFVFAFVAIIAAVVTWKLITERNHSPTLLQEHVPLKSIPRRSPTGNVKVTIVGAGVSGLALANALKSFGGFDVKVFERSPVLSPAIGGGFSIQSGLLLLRSMGFSQAILESHFKKIDILEQYTADGQLLANTSINESVGEKGLIVGGILRAELMALLANEKVDLHLGKELVEVTEKDDFVVARFSDGTEEESDIIVGCDGLKSTVRSLVFEHSDPIYSGHAMWYGVSKVSDELYSQLEGRMILQFGQGMSTGVYCSGTNRNVVFWKTELTNEPKQESWENVNQAKSQIAEFTKGIAEPFPTVVNSAVRLMHFGKYYRQPLSVPWYKGRVVLIGDAAHPLLPYGGQGANIAIEDAVCLAKQLSNASLTLDEAFHRYYLKREPRALSMFKTSSRMAWLQHPTSTIGVLIRDNLYKLASRLGINARYIAKQHRTVIQDAKDLL